MSSVDGGWERSGVSAGSGQGAANGLREAESELGSELIDDTEQGLEDRL